MLQICLTFILCAAALAGFTLPLPAATPEEIAPQVRPASPAGPAPQVPLSVIVFRVVAPDDPAPTKDRLMLTCTWRDGEPGRRLHLFIDIAAWNAAATARCGEICIIDARGSLALDLRFDDTPPLRVNAHAPLQRRRNARLEWMTLVEPVGADLLGRLRTAQRLEITGEGRGTRLLPVSFDLSDFATTFDAAIREPECRP